MKRTLFTLILLIAFSIIGFAQADKIIGRWKTIDDKDGSAKSIVYIFKATNGKYYGKIEKLFKEPEKICAECEGTNKNQPILGMMIINNLVEKDAKLTGGTILDPNNGKIYKCNLSIGADGEKLNVRGSLDRGGWIGRSQTWLRIK
ncbi:MAG: DUF2147 domain-containing protein [Paludibacter sp.]|nr:DUF2147 domain-containing protein [Paludibacter sp.]